MCDFYKKTLREKYKGGIYHVNAIVYNKEYIFIDNLDKDYFLNDVKKIK